MRDVDLLCAMTGACEYYGEKYPESKAHLEEMLRAVADAVYPLLDKTIGGVGVIRGWTEYFREQDGDA